MASSFKDLRVWREAMNLAFAVYHETKDFPKHEVYGLTQQMRRAAVSVPSNIAEGKEHRSDRVYAFSLSCSWIIAGIADADSDCGGITILARRQRAASPKFG
jgi:hypothetical protein